RAEQGQPDRGRPVAVPPGARGRLHRRRRARADRVRQGSPEGRPRRRHGRGRDRGARDRRASFLSGRGRDLRRRRHRRQDHDSQTGHRRRLPAELAVLVRQRRLPAGRGRAPDAEVVLHPYSGEAGAIGAALCAADWRKRGGPSHFRGFDTIAALTYTSTTSAQTVCKWCPINCTRTFIDVQLPGAKGREWSKLPLAPGWERVISGNSCPKGLVEDVNEMRVVKAKLEEVKREYPNVAEMVRKDAFRRVTPAAVA